MHELSTERDETLALELSTETLDASRRARLSATAIAFLDSAAAESGRASYYNTRAEQEAAADLVHDELLAIDRGIYAAALLLRGITDRACQRGVRKLLASPCGTSPMLPPALERALLERVLDRLPPQRVLKLFGELRRERVNGARTRKLILRYVLGARALELWSVKYRRKIAAALTHAWGKRLTSVIRSVLAKTPSVRAERESVILCRSIRRFTRSASTRRIEVVEECVRFVLGDETRLTLERLRSYSAAKSDLERGTLLPFETLEGIRGRFHRRRSPADALAIAKSQLTSGQRIALQRTADEAGVDVAVDLASYDAVRLYLYAFEMGMSDELRNALRERAVAAARRMPLRYQRIAIIVDTSASMLGHETRYRRPIATALALRDLLASAAETAWIATADGGFAPCFELAEARGDTSLARSLVNALWTRPEAVFALSDGYENAPAGRAGEVIAAARRIGVETPVFQLSPVLAAESFGVRRLAACVPAAAVEHVESLSLVLLRSAFEISPERGLEALAAAAGFRRLEAAVEFEDTSPHAEITKTSSRDAS